MSPTPNFAYTTGNPDNLVGGNPAVMTDIQGPFYDLRAYLNAQIVTALNGLSPPASVLTGARVLDVGVVNQVRAGRQLTLADFTNLGLSAPAGLWNLSNLTDASGNGRTLVNKGSVPFATGINGAASTAAQFSGNTGQALYIADTGAADPFRIKTGSWGCWFRTAKRGVDQNPMGKFALGPLTRVFTLGVGTGNAVSAAVFPDGSTAVAAAGVSDVADDRWHFAVGTADGTTLRTYVDGVLEASAAASVLFSGAGPLNVGGVGADGSTTTTAPFFGRVDEAFVTPDILTEDQIRILYAAKVPHGLTGTPRSASLNVHRYRKGAALATTDFPATPLRLHNFTAGALTDQGTNGQALTTQLATPVPVAGADGTKDGGYSFAVGSLAATDAGLPSGISTRSYGCWFKTTMASGFPMFISWGTKTTGDSRVGLANGVLMSWSAGDSTGGGFYADGQWHFVVVVEDNAAGDGQRRKVYGDGRLAGSSTVLNATTLGGANRFRVGAAPDGSDLLTGQIDAVFVTGTALTPDHIATLYAKGAQDLGASPKNPGDHIERVDATDVYAIFDNLESQHAIDLSVIA